MEPTVATSTRSSRVMSSRVILSTVVVIVIVVILTIYLSGRHPGAGSPQGAATSYANGLASQSKDQLEAIAGFSGNPGPTIEDDLRQLHGRTLKVTHVSVVMSADAPAQARVEGLLDGQPFVNTVFLSHTSSTMFGWKDGWHVNFGGVAPLNESN